MGRVNDGRWDVRKYGGPPEVTRRTEVNALWRTASVGDGLKHSPAHRPLDVRAKAQVYTGGVRRLHLSAALSPSERHDYGPGEKAVLSAPCGASALGREPASVIRFTSPWTVSFGALYVFLDMYCSSFLLKLGD